VRITKVGIHGAYQIKEILEEHVYRNEKEPVAELVYVCEQNDDGYRHRVRVGAEELVKL
jgi:hypothetical protein